MSVGLLVVRLLYCFYVFGHLSKWFTFSVLLSVIFCRVVVFYACTQRLLLENVGEFEAASSSHGKTETKVRKTFLSAHQPQWFLAAVVWRKLFI